MNECCFKGSPVSKVPASCDSPVSKDRRVATRRYLGNRRVVLLFVFKNIRGDLNFWAINLKISQIVVNYVTYNLWKI